MVKHLGMKTTANNSLPFLLETGTLLVSAAVPTDCIAKIDQGLDGLQGYSIQQDIPNYIDDYYYDASSGETLRTQLSDMIHDVGRGLVGDVDPQVQA